MKANDIIKTTLTFMIFVLFHVLIVKYFVIASVGLCFFLFGFFAHTIAHFANTIAFVDFFLTGFFVDLFYDTAGIHIFASVAIIYFRPKIITLLTPLGGYDKIDEISISSMGVRWFLTYSFILILIHSTLVFVLQAGGFSSFHWTIIKIFCTSIFTTFMVCSFLYLLFTSKTN